MGAASKLAAMTEPTMTPDPQRRYCPACQRPLAPGMEVCPYCAPSYVDSARFRVHQRTTLPPAHRCPSCQTGFDVPATRQEPETAPWWRPQSTVWSCPNCRAHLDWVPNAHAAAALSWAGLRFSALAALMLALSTTGNPLWQASAALEAVWYGLALFNIVLLIGAFKQESQTNAKMLTEARRPELLQALDLMQGSFVIHSKPQRPPTPQPFGLLMFVVVALYLGGIWWRSHGGLPDHTYSLLAIIVLMTAIGCVGLFRSRQLWRVMRAEATASQGLHSPK